jgi:hypothetical protein
VVAARPRLSSSKKGEVGALEMESQRAGKRVQLSSPCSRMEMSEKFGKSSEILKLRGVPL